MIALTGCNGSNVENEGIEKNNTEIKENKKDKKIATNFDNGTKFNYGYASVLKNKKWAVINTKGELLTDYQFQNSFYYDKNGFGHVDNTTYRIKDDTLIKMDYKTISNESNFENRIRAYKGKKWGYVDKDGKEVIEFKYDVAESFYEELAYVEINKQGYFINTDGKVIIDLKGNTLGGKYSGSGANNGFNNGFAVVKSKNNSYFIDKTGKQVGAKYEYAQNFGEKYAAVKLNNKWGFIDKTGKLVINFQFDDAYGFEHGIATVKKGNKWGIINESGKVIVPFKFDGIMTTSNKSFLPCLKLKGSYYTIDSKGKLYKGTSGVITNDVLSVSNNGKYGLIKPDGTLVTEFKYDYIDYAEEENKGLYLVKLNNKWGVIDSAGKVIVDIKYDKIDRFSDSVAFFNRGDIVGLLDITGKEITVFDDQDIKTGKKYFETRYGNGLILVFRGRNYVAYMDKNGKYVIGDFK